MSESTPGFVFGQAPLSSPSASPPVTSALPGHLLVPEDVQIIEVLGDLWEVFERRAGGMGYVCLCVERDAPRFPWALKSFARQLVFNAASRRAFERECATAILLSNIHGVMPVVGIHYVDKQPHILMPGVLPDGQGIVNLRDVIDKRELDIATTMFYLSWIAHTMSSAAAAVPGLVHGDLKPENILMYLGVPQISDFGLARAAGAEIFADDAMQSTARYRAPELAQMNTAPSPLSDVFAFGVIMKEMLDVDPDPPSPAKRIDNPAKEDALRTALVSVADKCCAEQPDNRPADFRVVEQALARLARDSGLTPPSSALAAAAMQQMRSMLTDVWLPRQVHDLIHLNHADLALQLLQDLQENELPPRLLGLKASALSDSGRLADALTLFDKAVAVPSYQEREPAHAWVTGHERALCLKRLARFANAAEEFQRLAMMALDKKSKAQALGNLGACLIELGRNDEAEHVIRQSLRIAGSKDANNFANRAVIAYNRRDYTEAIDWLRKAAAFEPSSPRHYMNIGKIFMDDLGNIALAANAFAAAFNCGETGNELILRRMTCAFLMDDKGLFGELLDMAAQVFQPNDIEELWHNVTYFAALHARKFGSPATDIEDNLPDVYRRYLDEDMAKWSSREEESALKVEQLAGGKDERHVPAFTLDLSDRMPAELAEEPSSAPDESVDEISYSIMVVIQFTGDLSEAEHIALRYASRLFGFMPLLSGHCGVVWQWAISDEVLANFQPGACIFAAMRRYETGEFTPHGGSIPADVSDYVETVRCIAPHLARETMSIDFRTDAQDLAGLCWRGRDDQAEMLLSSMEDNPSYAVLWCFLALAALRVEALATAKRRLDNALRLDDQYASAWNLMGRVHLRQGSPSEAVKSASRAAEVDPRYTDYRLLAECYQALGNTVEAERMIGLLATRGYD